MFSYTRVYTDMARNVRWLEVDPPLLHVLQMPAICFDMAVAPEAGFLCVVAFFAWYAELHEKARRRLQPQGPVTIGILCDCGAQRLLPLNEAPDTRQLFCNGIACTDIAPNW